MTDIRLHKSSGKAIKIFLIAIPFLIIGVWIITRTEPGTIDRIMGWVCAIFSCLIILAGLFHLLDRRPQIIINEIGIWDRTTNIDVINWEVIQDAYPIDIFGEKFISLIVNDDIDSKVKQYKWATKLSESFGAQKINLHISQIKVNQIELSEFIKAMSKADLNEKKRLIKTLPDF